MKYLSPLVMRSRYFCILLGLLMVATAGCGGGGGSMSSSGDAVNVSLASAPGFPAGTVFTSSPSAAEVASKTGPASFDNVFVEIRKVALLPAKEAEGPDPNGEVVANGSGKDDGFVSAVIEPPVVVDLRHLPPGRKLARFLNKFLDVPAGTYGKIRVYYSHLWGVRGEETVDFHPTANSHFDVHFVDGNLVIPVGTDVGGGVRLHDVTIHFVGLKIVENPNKVLIRPQVFATVEPVQYVVSGIADNVTSGAFDISPSGIHATFSSDNNVTHWTFQDNDTMRQVAIDNNLGIAALMDGAIVEVYGKFTVDLSLFADHVVLAFPDAISGTVVKGGSPPSVWQNGTGYEFFELNPSSSLSDNVVILKPDRTWGYYDNAVSGEPLTDAAIDNNVSVKARGYILEEGAGIQAYWISVEP